MKQSYQKFLNSKAQQDHYSGFEPRSMPSFLFPFQTILTDWALRKGKAAIFADCGLGKGQPPDSNVLTPTGWRTIGGLERGDRVIASDGKTARVLGTFPKLEQDTYRVHFRDGASIVVDLDHLHICRTNNDRQRGKSWCVKSTAQLLSCGNLRYGADDKSRNYDIPVVRDVEFDARPLQIDPYVIGVLLGDGHLKGNVLVSSADTDVLEEFARRLPATVTLQHKSRYDWRLMTGLTGSRRHPFRQALADLGLLGTTASDKFVPRDYLFSSSEQRLDLLRGLMDTDGYIGPEGTCQFYSVSAELAKGATHLVRSLGGIPTVSVKETSCDGKKGQPCHVVTFSLATHNPFFLPRKAVLWNQSPRNNGRWIERIEFEKRQRTVCIRVDSVDSSYVTEHFVVTHNTPMQLVWADNVIRKTNKPVLILTPLAVARQTIKEADKFGFDCRRSKDGELPSGARIIVSNYERLHYFQPDDFAGVVCDESSAIKSFDGKRRAEVTEFMRTLPYRLLCTATAAPNDYIELGTSSEALGELGHMDMLNRFFKNDNNTSDTKGHWRGYGAPRRFAGQVWRFKGHAQQHFWRWVCSWARAIRKPSDLSCDDTGFVLPPLIEQEHIVEARRLREGMLFAVPAANMREEREERRRTIHERCEMAAELVNNTGRPAVVWCHLNDESKLLDKLIPDAREIAGATPDDEKEELYEAFSAGQLRVLVTKPKIGAWGLNWQHCNHVVTFASHSYEQYYQSVRRCWRFGQKKQVTVDLVATEGEQGIMENLRRKSYAADKMFIELVAHMNDELKLQRKQDYTKRMEAPAWL